ncbi:helix-turn-helix domain-containing protein [Streptomyces sp. NPDC002486]
MTQLSGCRTGRPFRPTGGTGPAPAPRRRAPAPRAEPTRGCAAARGPAGPRPLPVTKSTTTHHFRVLRESGVIRQVYRGTAKMNGLRRDELDALYPGLMGALLDAANREAARPGG